MAFRQFALVFQQALNRHWRLLFVVMLGLLHLSAMRGASDFWARGFMLAHFGMFILWQPFMRGEHRLSTQQSIAILAISAGILLFLNAWLLGLWVSVLAGIVGGKVFLFQARWLRRFYMLVLLYLIALLLVWIVPNTFLTGLTHDFDWLVQYGLPLLFIVMLVVPTESDTAETPQMVDFFYATFLFLVLVVLSLGTFAFMRVANLDYWGALSYSLFVIAGVLLALSLAWNPRTGFAGLSMYFSRYLLSIGLPFEQWLRYLAELSQMESRPDRFVQEACSGLARLPWVGGGTWRAGDQSGRFGEESAHFVEYHAPELQLCVYSRNRLSPSLAWHFQLLGQLLGEFYLTKVREQELQQQTYLQAVYETGARMTHDMKNLLQSLNILCSAAELDDSADAAALNELVRRQLPVISQRLQQALAKLQKPQLEVGQFVPAGAWWEGFKRSYRNRNVNFAETELPAAATLPKELFDSAGDNLLQNALRKRKLDQAVSVEVTLRCTDQVELTVCDSGAPVPAQLVQGLLRGPVPSESGFGIGLFQTAKHAANSGYELTLSCNEPGKVCFSLRGVAPDMASARQRSG